MDASALENRTGLGPHYVSKYFLVFCEQLVGLLSTKSLQHNNLKHSPASDPFPKSTAGEGLVSLKDKLQTFGTKQMLEGYQGWCRPQLKKTNA